MFKQVAKLHVTQKPVLTLKFYCMFLADLFCQGKLSTWFALDSMFFDGISVIRQIKNTYIVMPYIKNI